MRSVVRMMRLKLTAKNKIGGQTSWSSLITNARRRGLGMNGFLRTRGRMSPAQLELNRPNPKSLETFSMDSSSAKESNQRTPYFSAGPDPGFRTNYQIPGRALRIQSRSERMNLPVLQRAERHACAEQIWLQIHVLRAA